MSCDFGSRTLLAGSRGFLALMCLGVPFAAPTRRPPHCGTYDRNSDPTGAARRSRSQQHSGAAPYVELFRYISAATIPESAVLEDIWGNDMPPAKEQSAVNAESRLPFPIDILKLSALGGALLYGILFLGYYTYYGRLGLRPEDLGVSYTYILVRSIGFIMLMGAIVGVLSIIYLIISQLDPGPVTRGDMLRFVISFPVGSFIVLYAIYISPATWPSWAPLIILLTIISIGLIGTSITKRNRTRGFLVFAILVLLTTIILPAVAVVARANNLASQVLADQPVAPYELFGVPILDISASTVTVNWIGPPNQRPAIFGSKSSESVHGLLLGTEAGTAQAGTTVLLVSEGNGSNIILVPSNLVLIEEG